TSSNGSSPTPFTCPRAAQRRAAALSALAPTRTSRAASSPAVASTKSSTPLWPRGVPRNITTRASPTPSRARAAARSKRSGAHASVSRTWGTRIPPKRSARKREATVSASARARECAVTDRAVASGAPDGVAEARSHHLHLVARRQQACEQVGASGGVVREVEGEDGDLHATRRRA